jgi:hypothetical protein
MSLTSEPDVPDTRTKTETSAYVHGTWCRLGMAVEGLGGPEDFQEVHGIYARPLARTSVGRTPGV